MNEAALLEHVLDSIDAPILVADTEHRVVYMNRVAEHHYTGGRALMGTNLLDCHNDKSNRVIVEVLKALKAGEDERLISESTRHRIYMRAVRDETGALVGYYERYESPWAHPK